MVSPTFCLETSSPRLSHPISSYFIKALTLPRMRPFLIILSKRTIPTRHSQPLFSALFFFIALISTSQYIVFAYRPFHSLELNLHDGFVHCCISMHRRVVHCCISLHSKVLREYLWNGQLNELWVHHVSIPTCKHTLKEKLENFCHNQLPYVVPIWKGYT